MFLYVLLCFLIFFTAGASLQLVPNSKFKIQNSKFRIQNLPKFFFFITLKKHLEAQLRHTLWQTSRVCQSFFLHYFKRAFRSTIAPHTLANFKNLPKFFFSIILKEHLEAQLRHTLWQTSRVCQSFFSS